MATDYAKKYIYQPKTKTLLDEMVYFGKQLYFKDAVIPFKTDAEKIGYTQEQLDWALANEQYIWQYFVEKNSCIVQIQITKSFYKSCAFF